MRCMAQTLPDFTNEIASCKTYQLTKKSGINLGSVPFLEETVSKYVLKSALPIYVSSTLRRPIEIMWCKIKD